MERTTSDLGIFYYHLDYQIEGIEDAYRMVFPVPEIVASKMSDDELWFQIEHQAQQALEPNLMGLKCELIRKGILSDPEALATLDRKTIESQLADQHGLILP